MSSVQEDLQRLAPTLKSAWSGEVAAARDDAGLARLLASLDAVASLVAVAPTAPAESAAATAGTVARATMKMRSTGHPVVGVRMPRRNTQRPSATKRNAWLAIASLGSATATAVLAWHALGPSSEEHSTSGTRLGTAPTAGESFYTIDSPAIEGVASDGPAATPLTPSSDIQGEAGRNRSPRPMQVKSGTVLRFKDGSQITAPNGATLSVEAPQAHGAEVRLIAGQVEVNVVHHVDTHWAVAGGPFRVEVTGTRFDFSWDALTGCADLRMHEGSVNFQGPNTLERRVVAGENIVECAQDAASPGEDSPDAGVTDEPAEPKASSESRAPANANSNLEEQRKHPSAASQPSSGPPAASPPSSGQSVEELQRRRVDIIKKAEELGVDVALDAYTEAELEELAHAARYAGESSLANRCYLRLRSRFPDTEVAAGSAFFLARLAEDRGSPRSAANWYQRYLAESKAGNLRSEALGRLMLSYRQLGEQDRSAVYAKTLLEEFPNGSYAAAAREVLATPSP